MQVVEPQERDASSGTRPNYRSRNFPLNCWWVAARSHEITTTPLARRLLDLPVVLYRTEGGRCVAAADRCPHRWAPLSYGAVAGETIVCRYHGLQFGTNGECVHIPSQERIAANVSVPTYPLIERYGFVWIWAGDAAASATEEPPDLPFLEDPDWHRVDGAMSMSANYLMFKENVLDLTHLSFLHAATAGVADYDTPPEVTIENDIVHSRQTFLACKLGPLYRDGLDIDPERLMDRYTWGASVSPALQSNGLRIVDPHPAEGARSEFVLRILHFATPETMSSSHYWWTLARDHGRPWNAAAITGMTEAVFNEDKWMLEAIQRTADTDELASEPREISLSADRAALAVRRAMARRVAAEHVR